MKLLILTLFFSFCFGFRTENASDYLSFESNEVKYDQPISFSEADSSEVYYPFFDDLREEKSEEDKPDSSADSSFSNEHYNFLWPTTYERISNKHLLEHLFQIYQERYRNNENNFQRGETYPNERPTRSQVTNWKASDEFFDHNNMPGTLDNFYSKLEPSHIQNEFLDAPNYSFNLDQKNSSFAEVPEGLKDPNYPVEYPQYYQKNYYYNYYPLIKGQKNVAPKWSDGKLFSPEINREKAGEKKHKKNPCRQYLEFLKYAFRELDENAEHNYEYIEDYNDEWGGSEAQKSHRLFMTQMHGPTLYVDNSGKISQMSSKGHGVQMFGEVSPSSKVSSLMRDFIHLKPTVPSTTLQGSEKETKLPSFGNFFHSNNTDEQTPDSDFPTSRLFPQWTSTARDYPTSVTADINEKTTFDYSTSDAGTTSIYTTTPTPDRFSLGDYHVTLENSLEGALARGNSGNSNASVGPSLYWYTKSSTSAPWGNPLTAKTTISLSSTAEDGGKEENDCNDKVLPCPDTVNITYPLNGYCNRYVSCESGRAIRRTCPEGLHFNIITKSCDFPHNSFCSYFCPKANGHFGIPGDCTGYFICQNFVPEYRMCPPKMHWDIKRAMCMFAELSSCPMKCFKANEVKSYEGDCKAYIICLNGFPYYHKCPPNTKFDIHAQSCIPEYQSQCQDDPRLLTKTSNPNSLCKDIELKFGTKVWCNYFQYPDNYRS